MNHDASESVHLHVVHVFAAPATRVFDAWLDPDALSRWMFGPAVRDERIVHLRLDAREGGAFSFRVERAGAHIEHAGTYTAIERPRRLAFTWGAWLVGDAEDSSSVVEIEIAPHDIGCELRLTHTMSARWSDYLERTEQGWRHMLGMLDAMIVAGEYGALLASDTIRFERLLPGPIERVWAYLVESDKRALWLAGGPMELAAGGAIELNFRNAELSNNDDRAPEKYCAYENSGRVVGTITQCDPPTLLAYTWGDTDGESKEAASEVRFELTPHGDRVLLVLTHRRLSAEAMTSVASGWHTHLGILEDRLRGCGPRPFWRTHTALEAEYVARLNVEQ